MTDNERLLTAPRARGPVGIHSHEIRKLGISGNPSQRISELEEAGYSIEHKREHKGRRPGVRYTLVGSDAEVNGAAATSPSDSSSLSIASSEVGVVALQPEGQERSGEPEYASLDSGASLSAPDQGVSSSRPAGSEGSAPRASTLSEPAELETGDGRPVPSMFDSDVSWTEAA